MREATLGREAWERFGQYTMPNVAKHDHDGRASLYIAGFIAGYNEGREGTPIGALDANEIAKLVELGATTDGSHRKQWCLAQIGAMVGVLVEDGGIAP